jgi:hypothetical protein
MSSFSATDEDNGFQRGIIVDGSKNTRRARRTPRLRPGPGGTARALEC